MSLYVIVSIYTQGTQSISKKIKIKQQKGRRKKRRRERRQKENKTT
jgi:hypothetical protein